MNLKKTFGLYIKELRQAKNVSQEEIAHFSSLNRSYISQIENGHKEPSLSTIIKLAKALNTSPSKLLQCFEDKIDENS